MNFKKVKSLLIVSSTILITSACTLPGLGDVSSGERESITVAGQVSTEGTILTYIVQQMVEHYLDTNAEVIINLGTSSMVHQAMLQEDANIGAAKYTGTSLTGELGVDAIKDPDEALEVVVEGFDEEFNMEWFPTYGFANTYAFMVTQEVADEYGFEKISDVADHASELTAGVDSSWLSREGDGYDGFVEEYGFDFGEIYPMQIGLVYDAVEAGEMDIVLGYSTDGRIASYDLVVLEDDLNFFPPYDTSPVANFEVLDDYPELENILLKLEGQISPEQMQELNYIADDMLIEPAIVAETFLEANNYFEDLEPHVEVQGGQNNGIDN